MARTTVVYEDLGLATLEADTARLLEDVLEVGALWVERGMKQNIVERGFVDTRATVNSVAVDKPAALTRDIGPSTEYAIYGELGYVQTHAWGRKLARVRHHPGLHFARDALMAQRGPFMAAVNAALARLGKRSGR